MTPLSNRRPNRRGFSLLEAMITLVIMLVIIGGATALFFENQNATTAHVALAELRTNMRFALDTMASDLRVVGAYTKWAPLQILDRQRRLAGRQVGLLRRRAREQALRARVAHRDHGD